MFNYILVFVFMLFILLTTKLKNINHLKFSKTQSRSHRGFQCFDHNNYYSNWEPEKYQFLKEIMKYWKVFIGII